MAPLGVLAPKMPASQLVFAACAGATQSSFFLSFSTWVTSKYQERYIYNYSSVVSPILKTKKIQLQFIKIIKLGGKMHLDLSSERYLGNDFFFLGRTRVSVGSESKSFS